MLYPFLGLEFVLSPSCLFLALSSGFSKWVPGSFCNPYIPTLDSYLPLQLSLIYGGSNVLCLNPSSCVWMFTNCKFLWCGCLISPAILLFSTTALTCPHNHSYEHDEIGHRVRFRSYSLALACLQWNITFGSNCFVTWPCHLTYPRFSFLT